MDAGDLRVFEAVARLGGMNRAAGELNTVQSNVTARIRLLEEQLGTPLFHRHSRGVALTAAGQRLLPYAVRVRHLLDEARHAVADDGIPGGPLTLGSLETTSGLRLPPLLAGYTTAYPEVDLVLRTGTTAHLIQDVLEHRLDGAFVCGPVDHPDLIEETVFREELVLVTARAVRSPDDLARRGETRIIVFRAGCSYRQVLESLLAARGIVGVRPLEFGSLEGILGSVAAGMGVTLLPRGVVGPSWTSLVTLHELPPAQAHVETVFVRRRDGYVSSALAAFLDHARPAHRRADAAE
ncbi:MAG TPA: LysR family transcriptional regulator [Azospirillum sp.]|nr:LysR family transcriptional regulator [Azospirillum sp.]